MNCEFMKRRLLLVEDDADVRKVAERLLSCSFDVLAVGNCTDALAALRAAPFELVVTDFGLPDGTGRVVLESARELQPSALRVVVSGALPVLPDGLAHLVMEKPWCEELTDRIEDRFAIAGPI
jgi:DNA-binding NtrC family response regulator